ncbi:MAG TPA: autotransporter outer membrane beta-barrel domain-containing protein [Devosiaceae bacterium]|nr:autotransporter outer membrane beta-barrel domain-containing protein [Devosiaceae bacterium]
MTARKAAGTRRFPKVERSWLLGSTALLAGVLAGGIVATPQSARAASETLGVTCNVDTPNYYTCAGPETDKIVLAPSGTFQVDLGPNEDPDNDDPFVQTTSGTSGGAAFEIDAAGNSTSGNGVHLYTNSSIYNEDGIGLAIYDPGEVTVNIGGDEDISGYVGGSIIGTTGIVVAPQDYNSPGHVHIFNDGHIGGTAGAAIDATGSNNSEDGPLIFELDNHSYQSAIGSTDGVDIHHNIVWTAIDNGQGLIVGLNGDGVHIWDVENTDVGPDAAVTIDNGDSGIIGGSDNGIYIRKVRASEDGVSGDVVINNGQYMEDDVAKYGGLIIGGEDGVHVSGVYDGSVYLNNNDTLSHLVDLSGINLNPDPNGEPIDVPEEAAPIGTAGIWALDDGVQMSHVDGEVRIDNGNDFTPLGGIIVGYYGDAVQLSHIGGVSGEDGDGYYHYGVDITNNYGQMWGGSDGIDLSKIDGDVGIDNIGGTIIGGDEGIHIARVDDGSVTINNAGGGVIGGFSGDGIHIWNVDGDDGHGGDVSIYLTNNDTLNDTADLSTIIPGTDTPLSAPLPPGLPTGGIFGLDDGVRISDVDGEVSIDNNNDLTALGGLIAGYYGDAVQLSDVDGISGEDGDGNYFHYGVYVGNNNGQMWGGEDGIHLWAIDGDVGINNKGGTIVGGQEGIHIAKVDDGSIGINNAGGGLIGGLSGDGIHIWNVDGEDGHGGDVSIYNGHAMDGEVELHGGLIAGGEDGVGISGVDGSVYLTNNDTLNDTADLSRIIPPWEVAPLGAPSYLPTGGIWGFDDGVRISHVDGEVSIDNGNDFTSLGGLIVGEDGDAVQLSHIGGVSGENSDGYYHYGVDITNNYGQMWGSDDGIHLRAIGGDVGITNVGGTIVAGDDGIHIARVDDGSVGINNAGGGLIGGLSGDGIHIWNVDGEDGHGGDVSINNGHAMDGDVELLGGLIAGGEDGVGISSIDGSVYLTNNDTLNDTFNPSRIIPPWEVVPLDAPSYLPTGGIWGFDDGVRMSHVDGEVTIDNNNDLTALGGLIVGAEGDAVHLSHIAGVSGEDSDGYYHHGVEIGNDNGLMWGGSDGIHLSTIGGDVGIDNYGGAIVGLDEGIHIAKIEGGSVTINNAGGQIEGFYGDAVHIWGVQGEDGYGGNVSIINGVFDDTSDQFGGAGGTIVSADRAIDVTADSAFIGNGSGGLIIGDGSWQEPVIQLHTDNEDGQGAFIFNNGIMASDSLPNFSRDTSLDEDTSVWAAPDPKYVPKPGVDLALLQADLDNLSDFTWSGGQSGGIDNLPQYGDAASAVLVKASGGATGIENDGLMVGRLVLDGHNGSDWPDVQGNDITNFGTWLTVNSGQWGNRLQGSSNDAIRNGGLIQTAFDGTTPEETYFEGVNSFQNGGQFWSNLAQADVQRTGLVSMIDGGTGDYTYISHQFHGAAGQSFLGVDVNFAPGTPEDALTDDWETPATWRADRFDLGDFSDDGQIDGSTGLIVNKVGGGSVVTGDTIIVAYSPVDGNPVGMQCFDSSCKDGNTMYVASASKGYINVGGTGAIQDGLHAWYLHEVGEAPDPTFVLQSEWAPQAVQLPSLITGAQNVWHDTSSQVEDHVYGSHFPQAGEGGGGADVPVGETPAINAGYGSAMWGKISGSITNQDTTVNQTMAGGPPVTIDTSFVQNTFSLLGGVDFTPMDGSNGGLRLGVFAGYLNSNLGFTSYDASSTYSGGTVGGYAAYNNDGFYVDGEVKADLLNLTYTAPLGTGFSTSGLATNIGVLGNTGYRLQMGNSFIEPIGSLAYINTTLQDFSDSGDTVDFSNGQSLQAGAGVRVGTALATGDETTTELSLLGKVWNEFEPANEVTLTDSAQNSTTFTDSISGVFGEVAATATTYSNDRGFSGFVSVSDKFNDSFNTVTGKAGLRKAF